MKQVADHIKRFQKQLLDEDHSEESWLNNMDEDVNVISPLESEQQSHSYSKKQNA